MRTQLNFIPDFAIAKSVLSDSEEPHGQIRREFVRALRGIPNFASAQNSATKNPGLPCKTDKIRLGFCHATPLGQISNAKFGFNIFMVAFTLWFDFAHHPE
jgi:hypothetical protein